MEKNELKFYSKVVEAIIFSSSQPVKEELLISKIPDNINIQTIMKNICDHYAESGIQCLKIGNAWAFRTILEVTNYLNVPIKESKPLSRVAIETLAIIAYHQPITRNEIEKIRGVSISRGSIDLLLELNWILPKGRKNSPGRPILWVTTDTFLDKFCLEDINSLPGLSELKAAGLIGSNDRISDKLEVSNEIENSKSNLFKDLT